MIMGSNSIHDIIQNLKDPGNDFRGIPFWSWNDKLEPEELLWQIGQMKEAGLGGFFMHARAGLKTPYMSEEWMECVATCITEAGRLGIGAWLYDENGYPSGFAGGQIPAMGVEYCQKFLKLEVISPRDFAENPGTLGIYRATGSYERMNTKDIQTEDQILHAWYEINPYYTDLLNEKVVKAFIASTYDVYYNRFKEDFGRGMPGVFIDEPQFGRTDMPWSYVIPEKFSEMYGYDLLEYLPALYFESPDFRKVRYHFWNLVEKLFTSAVSKQIAHWCDEHNCQLTGHVLLEENMRFQTKCVGSAMGFYKYMQIPGIDWLGRHTGDPVIVKQVSSVAEQLGKKRVLSEMFAAAGWGTSIEEMKHIAEWQFVLGVNLICAHLEPYSLRGVRKKDHPPALFYQTNWWKDYRCFCDYFARLGKLLSDSGYKPKILILHPLRSSWTAIDASCFIGTDTNKELVSLDESFTELCKILSGLHLDYHFGDEEIIAEYGCIENGRFNIGKSSYSTIIIPPSIMLEAATVELLEEYICCGGKVYAFESFPYLVNGEKSDKLQIMKQQCIEISMDSEIILREMVAADCKEISITDKEGKEIFNIYHRMFSISEGSAIYLVNIDDQNTYEADITVSGYSNCYSVDLKDCSAVPLQIKFEKGKMTMHLTFLPYQSYVLMADNEPLSATGGSGTAEERFEYPVNIPFTDQWYIKLQAPNVLVLDYCRLSIERGSWSELKPIAIIQKELLKLGFNGNLALEFSIDCKYNFENRQEMFLVVEDAEKYSIEINGKEIKKQICGWWKDKCFARQNISGLIKRGQNKLVLRTHFYCSKVLLEKLEKAKVFEAEANMMTYDSEVENIYLLGEFSVKTDNAYEAASRNALIQAGSFYLDAMAERNVSMELTQSGYPFYSGAALLEQEFEIVDASIYSSLMFYLDKPHAALSRLFINGTEVTSFLWAPYEAEILYLIRNGKNTVAVQLVSTDRNIFGPHHHPDGELYSVGPKQFTEETGWTDSYCFIKFGLGEKAGLRAVKKKK